MNWRVRRTAFFPLKTVSAIMHGMTTTLRDTVPSSPRGAANPAKAVIERYLDALLAGDIDTIRDSFADDAVWSMHGDLPMAGPWRGRDRIVDDFLVGLASKLYEPGSQTFEFPTLIAEGSTVALEWRVTARSAAGADYENDYCGIFIVNDGKISVVREYFDSRQTGRILFPGLDDTSSATQRT